MVPLTALGLPILLAAVIVFVASAIMHMLLPYHKSDYQKLPDEDKLLAALAPRRELHGSSLHGLFLCTRRFFGGSL